MAVNPSQQQLEALAAIAGTAADAPLVMLNLNRYRVRAEYRSEPHDGGLAAPRDGMPAELSGRDAYARYGAVALQVIQRVGGEVVWSTGATTTVVGEEQERYEEVIAVRYPSAQAFLELAFDPAINEAAVHREAGLERALVILCEDSGEGPLRGF